MIAIEVANPFPGLRAFEPEEDYLFFGREKQVDELLSHLRRTHFLSVVGGSGSGKSSLVRAGLIPALYGGGMVGTGSRWRIAMFRPGEDPIGRMAGSLRDCGLIDDTQVNGSGEAILEATLRRSSLGLVEAFRLANLERRDNLLVIVDQFEELFRYRSNGRANYQDDAVAFVKLLLDGAEAESRIYVALTMRSDFIGNCADYPGLPPVVSHGQYLVPRMIRSELRDAITGPISVAGADIAPRLVVRLLNEAGEDPEQLPVLQHALMRTWEYWKRDHQSQEPIDIRHYEAVGTMARALSLHADEAFAELKTDRQKYIAEKAFKALTETDEQGRGVRRPTTFKAICGIGNFEERDLKEVLERFREPGRAFLGPPATVPLQSSTVLDLAHESLMRVWNRLQTWVAEEQQAGELYVRLSESAERYARGQQSLWRNPELGVGLQWLQTNAPNPEWAGRYKPGFEQAISFLNASQQTHKKKRAIQIGAISAVVFVALAAVGIYALLQRSENQQLRAVNKELNQTIDRLRDEIKLLHSRPKADQAVVSPPPAPAQPDVSNPPEPQTKADETVPPPRRIERKQSAAAAPAKSAPEQSAFTLDMLAAHNRARAKDGVGPLVWSNQLAAKAQKWADTLAATGETKMQGIPGQNIAYAGPPGRVRGGFIVDAWAAEVQNFDYQRNVCANPSLKCYHYTQVVWRDSKYVGCATAHDTQRDVWVCDYDPPGNLVGERPY